jgi:aminoglycoside 6'-N-acetyltransferase I
MMSAHLPPVEIRLAAAADKAEWLRMRRLLWPDEDADRMGLELDHILANERTPVFVAARPVGGLGGFLEAGMRDYVDGCDSSPVGYIEGWFVDEDLRGLGVGGALVSAAETWARGRGLLEMGSDAHDDNEASIRAHLALGYRDHEHLVHFTKKL